MTDLHIKVLGQPQVSLHNKPVTGFGTAKTEALFYFLAVTGQPQTREVLADLFWGEMDEGKAKRNLTKSLSTLRKLVDPFLEIERQTVTFKSNESVQLDTELFQTNIETGEKKAQLNALKKAIDLYQGDFLDGIYVKDSLPFEEWMLNQREHFRELMLDGLENLITQYIHQGDYDKGITYANRLLELDPWRESAHRQMMTLLARNGQRNAALTQYETCRRLLDDEFGVEPTPETTALYERLKTADAPPPHNLPPQSDAFIGRATELHQLMADLENNSCRLLTLVGPGGVGKTRLALQAATRYTDPKNLTGVTNFQGGIYLIGLAVLADGATSSSPGGSSELLISMITNTLQLPAAGNASPLNALIINLQKAGPTLLVLDNFEYFIEEAHILDRLLQQTPNLKLLVTSRERLSLRQEWVIELSGLTYPAANLLQTSNTNALSPLANAEKYSAVALFMERARQVRGDYALGDDELPDVIKICRLVEGTPLALELAASLRRLSTCAEIAAGIEANLDFLSSSLRNLPMRHRSLRAMFEHSWSLLQPQEQEGLRRLAVLRGGFQQEAAKAVAEVTLAVLASLIDKSLLRHSPSGRYSIHELLRQYAAEKLAQNPDEQETMLDRHSRYYATFLQQRGGEYQEAEHTKVVAELNAEADNIRAGWQHAIGSDQNTTVADINQYWYLGRFEQAAGLYHKSLAALHAPSPTWDRGLDLHQQGFLAYQQGDYNTARRRLTESLSVLAAAGDPLYGARSNVLLGMVAYDRGEWEPAEHLLRQSLRDLEALGESRYRSYALSTLGLTLQATDRRRSVELENGLRACLAINREVGDNWAVVHTLKNLGHYLSQVTESSTERGEALTLLQESLERSRTTRDAWGQVTTLNALGQVTLDLKDGQTAENFFHEAATIAYPDQFTPALLEALRGIVQSRAYMDENYSVPLTNWEASVLALLLRHPAASYRLQQQAEQDIARLKQSGQLPDITDTDRKKNYTLLLSDLIRQL
ncbi:MAG: hypothetical protein KDJ52_04820 [Anaerolineae bacterium]|nr:hypothetical protein [Anaerolineae bacterium]